MKISITKTESPKCEECGTELYQYYNSPDTGKNGYMCPDCGFSWDDELEIEKPKPKKKKKLHKIEILDAIIIQNKHFADKVVLKTNLTDPTYPFDDTLTLKFDVAKDNGEEFVKNTWPGLKYEVIKV